MRSPQPLRQHLSWRREELRGGVLASPLTSHLSPLTLHILLVEQQGRAGQGNLIVDQVRWKEKSPRARLESSKVLNEFNAKAELIVLQEDKNLISYKVN